MTVPNTIPSFKSVLVDIPDGSPDTRPNRTLRMSVPTRCDVFERFRPRAKWSINTLCHSILLRSLSVSKSLSQFSCHLIRLLGNRGRLIFVSSLISIPFLPVTLETPLYPKWDRRSQLRDTPKYRDTYSD